MSFALLLLVGAAAADRFGLRPDWPLEGLRPLESLALCGNATYKPLCDRAARFRALMQQRPRAPPRAAGPKRGAAPRPRGAAELADARRRRARRGVRGPLRVRGRARRREPHAREPAARRRRARRRRAQLREHDEALAAARRGALALTYSRYADVVYEFHRREDVDWAARARRRGRGRRRPAAVDGARLGRVRRRTPSSAVYVSHCVPWRAAFLAELEAAGVALERHGACAPGRRREACGARTDFNKRCKIDGLAAHPFAITSVLAAVTIFERFGDYVTEKWSHAWASGAVVVYVGSPLIHEREADYPPFINGLDFAGPGALAAYLHEVLANDTLWRRYAARGPPPNATRASGRHWGGITLDRHVCDACLAFYG
ncbi:hypothetical protein JL722_12391 [Aureococcus anophagefferens]|nr:hypothetical protein JL722_12391 [Aureococcus anophagefferens]